MASAEDYANWIVQNKDKAGTPEFETVAQAYKLARSQGKPAEKVDPTTAEKIAGSAPVRFAYGAAEPIIGVGQMAANALPSSAPTLQQLVTGVRPRSFGDDVNEHLDRFEGMIKAGRGKDADSFDAVRFAGNVASPVNAGIARVLPQATTTLGRIGTGVVAGGAGGASNPVYGANGDYWAQKGAQTALGAVSGGIATPVLGKLTDALAPRIEALAARFSKDSTIALGARASMEADQAIEQALRDIGAKSQDIGAAELQMLRQQVLTSLKSGKAVDAAALLRKQDFDAAGVNPTLGQLTRDPTQFATERNLRGVPNVGEPLQQRFDLQNQQLQQALGNLKGIPSEEYQAGVKLADALRGYDKGLKTNVDNAYGVARDHLGRAAPMDAAGFSKAANLALDDKMLGHYLPAEVRNILNDVSAGKIPFNVNTAVQIDSTLSAAQRAAGKGTPQSLAIGKVRDALNGASIADNVGQDAKAAFDTARNLASQRFKLHEAIPALEAAASGEAPDRFVKNYVIGGKVDEVKRLAEVLKKTSPEAFEEARSQIGAKIVLAAFGENTTGDKLATPERLAKALREIGSDKLEAFYTKGEIEQLKRLSRVAAYINSTPSSAMVNTSGNVGQIIKLATKIPGGNIASTALSMANILRKTAQNSATVNAAVKAEVPETAAKLTPEQTKKLSRLLSAGGFALGAASAR